MKASLYIKQTRKPGYVGWQKSSNDHLSRTTVASSLKRLTWKQVGQTCRFLFSLASDGVYMAPVVTNGTVVSYTAFPPWPDRLQSSLSGGIFLLH